MLTIEIREKSKKENNLEINHVSIWCIFFLPFFTNASKHVYLHNSESALLILAAVTYLYNEY